MENAHSRFVDAMNSLYGPDAIDHLSLLIAIAKANPVALVDAVYDVRNPPKAKLYRVVLKDLCSGEFSYKLSNIKLIREVLGYGLVDAKNFVESIPKVVKAFMPESAAHELAKRFEALGSRVVVEED